MLKRHCRGTLGSSNSAEIRHPADNIAISGSSSRTRVYAGRALGGLAVAILLFDSTLKVLMVPTAVEATTELRYAESEVLVIGMIEVLCLIARGSLGPRVRPRIKQESDLCEK
jgi:hypothetical protein